MSELELKIPPVVLALLFGALMWLTAQFTQWTFGLQASARAAGFVLMLTGIVLALSAALSFRKVGTTVHPSRPEASSTLVTSGVYRVTRNPMYLGLLIILIAWALILADPLSLALSFLFVPYMNRFQIVPEERALQQRYGEAFRRYCRNVRRWI